METTDGSIVTLADVLVFFTGADREPPLGFSPQPTLTFLDDNNHDILPTSSTCSLELRLPVHHSYSSFKDAMISAVKGHGGFGLV